MKQSQYNMYNWLSHWRTARGDPHSLGCLVQLHSLGMSSWDLEPTSMTTSVRKCFVFGRRVLGCTKTKWDGYHDRVRLDGPNPNLGPEAFSCFRGCRCPLRNTSFFGRGLLFQLQYNLDIMMHLAQVLAGWNQPIHIYRHPADSTPWLSRLTAGRGSWAHQAIEKIGWQAPGGLRILGICINRFRNPYLMGNKPPIFDGLY